MTYYYHIYSLTFLFKSIVNFGYINPLSSPGLPSNGPPSFLKQFPFYLSIYMFHLSSIYHLPIYHLSLYLSINCLSTITFLYSLYLCMSFLAQITFLNKIISFSFQQMTSFYSPLGQKKAPLCIETCNIFFYIANGH